MTKDVDALQSKMSNDEEIVGHACRNLQYGGGIIYDEVIEYRIYTNDKSSYLVCNSYSEGFRRAIARRGEYTQRVYALVCQSSYYDMYDEFAELVREERYVLWDAEWLKRADKDKRFQRGDVRVKLKRHERNASPGTRFVSMAWLHNVFVHKNPAWQDKVDESGFLEVDDVDWLHLWHDEELPLRRTSDGYEICAIPALRQDFALGDVVGLDEGRITEIVIPSKYVCFKIAGEEPRFQEDILTDIEDYSIEQLFYNMAGIAIPRQQAASFLAKLEVYCEKYGYDLAYPPFDSSESRD